MEWQPIETAPKNGRRVDLLSSSGVRFTDCAWVKPWNGDKERWMQKMVGVVDAYFDIRTNGAEFTHWMNPPPIPKGWKFPNYS
jgi:hypothetical protein